MACAFPPPCSAPPATQIWVKRYEWDWLPQLSADGSVPSAPSGCCGPVIIPNARCTFVHADTVLPALQDWPRWRPDASVKLPLDEYWRLSFIQQVRCPDPCNLNYVGCGVHAEWVPVWTRIETPRAWRWVASCAQPQVQCAAA